MQKRHFPRGKAAVIAALVLALGGFGMVSARVIPGIDEPYNPAAYYSLTAISWEDSPSPFALQDLAGGTSSPSSSATTSRTSWRLLPA